ncbi:Hypothetical predicted protein [Podarcis lilfordi]|uniref:Uncharacterized protein n=1 Tax=Podarcis lilfordi TaxID=74358 RepID=A0AA35NXD3_9SAUR|nr:Hypothetical predicted protein [Podarcis lilfordi]
MKINLLTSPAAAAAAPSVHTRGPAPLARLLARSARLTFETAATAATSRNARFFASRLLSSLTASRGPGPARALERCTVKGKTTRLEKVQCASLPLKGRSDSNMPKLERQMQQKV